MIETVIVGGGVSGLAAAYELTRAGRDVVVLEARARAGGNLVTERVDDFVLDGGPDSWLATKPHATVLARELGLGGELIPTREEARRVYVLWQGELHPMPEGVVLGIPTQWAPLVHTRLFSLEGKLRMALEPLIPPRRFAKDEDESIGAFVARRLGDEAVERLAGPLLSGIFAGDPDRLSARAAFPQLVEAERVHGSLVYAMQAMKRRSGEIQKQAAIHARGDADSTRGSAFVSLQSGIGSLPAALADALGEGHIRTGTAVKDLVPLAHSDWAFSNETGEARWAVELASGETLRARNVVLAMPAWASRSVTARFDPGLGEALDGVAYTSSATVFLAFRREDVPHRLDASGFLVPRANRREILAGTWVSSKWDRRAPEGYALVRAFFGGAFGGTTLQKDDRELVLLARSEYEKILGIRTDPVFSRVFRFERASAQPNVGHLARVRAIREAVEGWPGLHLVGTWLDGTGIPDAVRSGRELGGRLLREVDGRSARSLARLAAHRAESHG